MIRLFISILFVLSGISLFSQEFNYKNYNSENSLQGSDVFQVFKDSRSNIWIVSSKGVTSYNGDKFEHYRESFVLNNPVWEVFEDENNILWLEYFNGELSYIEKGVFRKYKYNSVLKNYVLKNNLGYNRYYHVDKSKNVFIKFAEGNIVKIEHSGVTKLNYGYNSLFDSIKFKSDKYRIIKSYKGDKFGSLNYIINLKNQISKIENIDNYTPISIKFKQFRVVVDENRLHVFNKLHQNVKTKTFNSEIIFVTTTLGEKLTVGLKSGGLIAFEDDHLDKTYIKLLPEYSISSIQEDNEGGIWVSTLENGVYYFPNLKIRILNKKNGLSADKVDKLCSTKRGVIIPDLNVDYNIFDLEKLKKIDVNHHGKFKMCAGIKEVDNKMFVSYYDRSFNSRTFIVEDDKIQWQGKIDIHNALKLNGDYYLYGQKQLIHLRDYKIHRVDKAREFNKVFSVTPKNDSIIWLATNIGLHEYNFNDFSYKKITVKGINENATIKKVLYKNSTLTLSTQFDGIVIVRDNTTKYINKSNGLTSNNIRDFKYDRNYLWIATNQGAFRYNLISEDILNFNTDNGLISNNVKDIEVFKNHVFVATDKGVSYFKNDINLSPFPIMFEHICYKGKQCDSLGFHEVCRHSSDLKIFFRAVSFSNSGNIEYIYKLEGYDKNYHSTLNTFVEYVNVPPGTYTFKLKARSNTGVESDRELEKTITIKADLYQMFWFRIVVAILVLGVMAFVFYLVYLSRLKMIRNRVDITTKINMYRQQALSAQMNPHFLFNSLNSVMNFIMENDKYKSRKYLSKLGVLMRRILNNSQESWITLDEEIEALNLYVEMELMRFSNSFEYKLNIDEDIDLEEINVPPLLIQPYVENAIHHGLRPGKEKGVLKLNIYAKNNKAYIEVKDNGVGRKQGILNTQKRCRVYKSHGTNITEKRIEVFSKIYKSDLKINIKDLYDGNGEASGTLVVIETATGHTAS